MSHPHTDKSHQPSNNLPLWRLFASLSYFQKQEEKFSKINKTYWQFLSMFPFFLWGQLYMQKIDSIVRYLQITVIIRSLYWHDKTFDVNLLPAPST